ncbi:GNAT family N-acetyltransferase [Mucilaginibacter mali]|uniref:GNAT family N-acetyltransferase n=1 Tax=Mucilaginibacter mali TaxID=2740462 RepID=A0A7D4UF61_9SPHI|nr:GNAT family N-acetyltransferase [Mucilaginibacter mali]QKJ29916.1 GNAT family N-acetyltransferase [Mucilaginibacter mali]
MSKPIDIYNIKRLSPDDIGDVCRLFKAVYHREQSIAFFRGKYNTAYMGIKYMGYIAYNQDGLPVAFYGALPCLLQHGNKKISTAQAADAMTHPDHRGRGLFLKLASLTVELCRENGIHTVFGFPNQNALPGYVDKLGWQVADTMDCFVIPVHRYNWEHKLKKLPMLRHLYTAYANKILKKYSVAQQGINNSALNEGFDGVYRTDDHFRYKTYSPTVVIRAKHALVWLKISNGLIIGDICLATNNFSRVMHTVLQLARRLGVKQVIFQSSPGTKLHGLFNERYWSAPSFQVIFKETGERLPLNRIKFTAADIDTF